MLSRVHIASPRVLGVVLLSLTVGLAACGSSGSLTGSSGATGTPIKVGMAVALTGYLASNDTPLAAGAKLAVKQINSQGGIKGHPLQLDVQDMASNAAQGVTVNNQLLNQNQDQVMVNGFTSAATAAEAPIDAAHKIPMIVASVLPQQNVSWVFSTIPPSQDAAQTQVGFAQQLFHAQSMGILYSQTPYGQLTANLLKQVATSKGMTVVDSEAVDTAATDITPQLTRIQAAHADVIADVLTGPVHLIEAKNAASLGLKLPIIMGIDTRAIFQSATASYSNLYWVAVAPQVYPNISNSTLKTANQTFINAYGADTAGRAYASRGWDAIYILAQALTQTNGQTGEALRSALEKMQPYQGATAVYQFTASDHYGISANPNVVAQYQGSTIKVVYPTGN